MPSGKVPGIGRRVVVRNAWLREVLAETIVKRHYGHRHPDDDVPIPKRFGVVRHRWGFAVKKQGAWFPVTGREVQEARLRAFRAGITFRTYMDFHLLRRNHEADPAVFRRGMWIKVRRDPPPCLPRWLTLFWTHSGISLIEFADELRRMELDGSPGAAENRHVIRSIIADMCRPLRPLRRRHRNTLHAGVAVSASPE